jgi:myo-inositol-1(or 4)-monophosphatase
MGLVPTSPVTPTLSTELALACDLARQAGAIQLDQLGLRDRVAAKGPRDVVTEADHRSEALILAGIHEQFPADGIVAEETGTHRGSRGRGPDPAAGQGRTWFVDPLDGTVNYANGLPIFCVSIGLAIDGQAAVGVIYDPTRDELFTAVAGHGAELGERPLRMPVKERLADCLVTIALPLRGWRLRTRAVRRGIRAGRDIGSASLALTYVGAGRFDAMIQGRGLSTWDVAAAGLIAQEAGATVTDLDGGPWLDVARPPRGTSILAAAPAHHAELLRLLAG